MSDQVLEQPVNSSDVAQPDTSQSEQSSDVSVREIREKREGDQAPAKSRRPYAHGESPFQRDRWRPDESESKGGLLRRFDKLTKRNADLESRLAEYESGKSQPQPAQPQGEPQGQQYESIDEMTQCVLSESAEREKTAGQRQPETAQPDQPKSQQDQQIVRFTPEQEKEWQRQHSFKAQTFFQCIQAATQADPELAEIRKNTAGPKFRFRSPLCQSWSKWLTALLSRFISRNIPKCRLG